MTFSCINYQPIPKYMLWCAGGGYEYLVVDFFSHVCQNYFLDPIPQPSIKQLLPYKHFTDRKAH